MKILFIHCAYRFKGGEEKVVEEEMKLLENAGHQVHLLEFSNEGNTLLKILQTPFNLSSYRKTKKAILRFAPDIVHVHNLHFAASPAVLYAAKHCKVPVVCTLHNYRLLCPSGALFHNEKVFLASLEEKFPWTAVRQGVYKNSKLLTFWLALATQWHQRLGTWKLPARYIVLTSHAKTVFAKSAIGVAQENFVVKPNFSSDTATVSAQRNETFLYVGRLSIEKGIHFLLRTFSRLPHRLIIAGDGLLKDDVIAAAEQHSNITYAGPLKKEQVEALMQQSSALIFPSIWYEGMPLTIIEAFANGLPVIASRLGAMECMVEPAQNGLLFEACNEDDLAATLAFWSGLSASQKASYSIAARKSYEQHYTPEKNAAQLQAIYQAVLPEEAYAFGPKFVEPSEPPLLKLQ
ncbi:MAG TPA: glycosyltransferase [Flavisolibacter sp.]|nr:glycosyltransferase [Flavisolibacter sp.]